MAEYRVMVLGGYGLAGLPIARLLLERSSADVVIAGRRQNRAESAAAALSESHPGRVRGQAADASDPSRLRAVLEGIDLVVDCTPTTAHVDVVTDAVIDKRVDYFDILYGPGKIEILEAKAERLRDQGVCLVTEGGYHPGLPSALIRYGATEIDDVDTAVVGGLLNHPLPYTEAVTDLIRGLTTMKSVEYRDGTWHDLGWSGYREFDFGPPHGRRQCFAMDFYELHGLPEQLGLSTMGFYMAGWGKAIDWGVFGPWYVLQLGRVDWGARLGAKLMCWFSHRTIKPPYGVVLKLEAEGRRGGEPARLEVFVRHEDGYLLTAIPTVACILQLIDGTIRRPGLWVMGQVVDPGRLMRDMESMGVAVHRQMTAAA